MALTKINTNLIAVNTIAASNIADNAIDATKIASNSILTRHIDDDQITGAQLADNIDIVGTLDVTGATTLDSTLGVTGAITGNLTGNASGTAGSVTVADNSANTNFPVVFHNESNSLYDDTGALRYNPSTGTLLAPVLTVAGTLGVTGVTTLSTHLVMGDDDIIKLGDSADLQIQHDGDHSIIADSGTGNLYMRTNSLNVVNAAGSENMLHAAEDGAVTLYYDNAAKLATVTAGIDVTGTVVCDGGNFDGASTFNDTGADVDFRVESDNDAQAFFVQGSDGKIGMGHSSPNRNLLLYNEGGGQPEVELRSNSIDGSGTEYGGTLIISLGAQSNSGSGNADSKAGDYLGRVLFQGQGTDYSYQGASIAAIVQTGDGNDGRSDQGVKLEFGTMSVGEVSYTPKMTIDQAGKVGIGNTSPGYNLTVNGTGAFNNTVHIESNAYLQWTGGTYMSLRGANSNNDMTWTTAPSAGGIRWYLTSGGRTGFDGNTIDAGHGNFVGEVGSGYKALCFEHTNGGGEVGKIITSASSATLSNTSDYRLKENVSYTWDATTRLKQLKPIRFNWVRDETPTLVDGFLAHEVADIMPEIVYGEKDAMTDPILYECYEDELPEGKAIGDVRVPARIDPQGISHDSLVPLLVKTIQELEARITTLEG